MGEKKTEPVRLIASDIDGTLLQNGEKTVSERLFAHIRLLREQGIYFCAASGRPYGNLKRLFAPVQDEIYYLCENGAVCFGPDGRMVSRTPVARETALALSRAILAVPEFEVMISGVGTSYLVPKSAEYVDYVRYGVGNHVTIVSAPEEIEEEILKVSAYCPDGMLPYQDVWRERWKELHPALGGQCWLDFGVADKRDGILGICGALGITPESVMAFGDNYNDQTMLRTVGYPYLMESAADELKCLFSRTASRPEAVIELVLDGKWSGEM